MKVGALRWSRHMKTRNHVAQPTRRFRNEICTNGTEIGSQFQGQIADFAKIFELVGKLLSRTSDPTLRYSPGDVSRVGTLTPDLLVVLLLFMVGDSNRRGYRHILDAFWDECATHDVPLPTEAPVTAAAFCQARAPSSRVNCCARSFTQPCGKWSRCSAPRRAGEAVVYSRWTAPRSTCSEASNSTRASADLKEDTFRRRPSALS